MYTRCVEMSRFDQNTFLRIKLCLIWAAGLSLGFLANRFYGDTLNACVALAPARAASVWGALSVNVLPLLISACAVFFIPAAVFPLCFGKGLCIGLGLGAVAAVYSSAGWMMSGLLMFSAVSFAPVLFWYWMRRLELGVRRIRQDTLWCLMAGLLVAGADVWFISPFLQEVMNF